MKVEIWSDVVCPWCYIGKRRFESALSKFEHRDAVTVEWKAFELDPTASKEPAGNLAEKLARKYGMTVEQAKRRQAEVTSAASSEGLAFDFERARTGNTFDAHRLIHFAAEKGLQDAVKERLMKAYFEEGDAISDPETLVRLAADAGLSPEEARSVLESGRYAAEVRADEHEASAIGISGVPFFVVDRKYGVSGAQSAETLLQVLEKSWDELHPVLAMAGGNADGVCEGDSCPI